MIRPPHSRRCRRLALFGLVAFAGWSSAPGARSAHAQTGDVLGHADALFHEGREAMRKGDYASACDKFRQSDALDPSPGTRLNWALCGEALGHLAEALEHARWALEHLSASDDREPIAARVTADLEKRVPRLTLHLTPDARPDAHVYVDDQAVAVESGEATVRVDPGAHIVFVEEGTRPTARFPIALREGDVVSQTVGVGSPWRSAGEMPPGRLGATRRHAAVRRNAGYALAGVGAASAATAVVMAVLAANEHATVDHYCPGQVCDPRGFDAANRGRGYAHVGALALGLAAASVTGAVILLWPLRSRDAVSLAAPSGGVSLSFQRGF